HLAGKAHSRDGVTGKFCGLQRFANGEACGTPPVARILLSPAGFGTREVGVFFDARAKYCAVFIQNDGAGAAGANVNAEDRNEASSTKNSAGGEISVNVHGATFKTSRVGLSNARLPMMIDKRGCG